MIYLYRILVAPFLILGFLFAAVFSKKIRQGLAMRLHHVWKTTGSAPPIWIHAASGEFEYAKPVITELKKRFPQVPILVTYFSPTFVSAVQKFPGVDFHGPLPLDTPAAVQSFIKIMHPRLLLVARTDLWPEVLHQTRQRGIPRILFSATQSTPPSLIKKWSLSFLSEIHCVSPLDADQLHRAGVTASIVVSGDTRYDQVLARLQNPKKLTLESSSGPVFVAGSTWPADDDVIIEALRSALLDKTLQLLLVPHEPTPAHLAECIRKLQARSIPYQLYSTSKSFDQPVMIVDQVGILAELYTRADVAFVGGSFVRSVHSVMEPLAAGVPVVVGPHHKNNREALQFQQERLIGDLCCVTAVHSAQQLAEVTQKLLSARPSKALLQEKIQRQTGATKKLLDSLATRLTASN
jgi:3-deoxy-D-manno-octulosonic-acid transferase